MEYWKEAFDVADIILENSWMMWAVYISYFILALAVLMSGCLFLHNVRKNGLSVPPAAGMFALGLVLAWFFAKGVYVCPNYSALKAHGIGKWFLLIPEQFSFVGGAIGFCLAPVLFRAKKRREIPAYLDQLAFPAGLLAALMRFDEIFLGELGLADLRDIGLQDMTDGDLFARFPFAVKDSWGVWYLAVCTIAALMILVIIGCMVGAVVSAAFFVLRALLDTTIYSSEEIAKVTNCPVIGNIPHVEVAGETPEPWIVSVKEEITHGN